MNENFKSICRSIGIEAHRSNGRVERVIRTISDVVVKLGDDMSLNEKMEIITDKYNLTYNIRMKCSSLEALIETKWETVVNNTAEGPYSKRFGNRMNESKYQKGNAVR
ncbi:putative ltr retrotransposon [Pseudoloma neurophilia]|uniref:Putative ltr retrotransposon n=1 Tax=Pseudoloma neurophilia TaxID=146866 RepID=A0A0R0M374_9MICR|nr:putative ltr retrotransposon [Pseudoloma neurophilia]